MLIKYLNQKEQNMWLNPEQVVAIGPTTDRITDTIMSEITVVSDGHFLGFASCECPDKVADRTNEALLKLKELRR
jgi:hypothetical protein